MTDLHERLVAALTARLEVARAATPGPWYALANGSVTHAGHEESLHGSRWGMYVVASTGAHSTRKPSDPDAAFIATTDPAAEIRRVEALLRVVALHVDEHLCQTIKDGGMFEDELVTALFRDSESCPTLRDLAAGEGIEET